MNWFSEWEGYQFFRNEEGFLKNPGENRMIDLISGFCLIWGFKAVFRFQANVKSDIMSDQLIHGVTGESCEEGRDIKKASLK